MSVAVIVDLLNARARCSGRRSAHVIVGVLILLDTCSNDLVQATRQMAVLALPSVTLRSRLPSWFSMNHLAPLCSVLGGFFAAAAFTTGAALAACATETDTVVHSQESRLQPSHVANAFKRSPFLRHAVCNCGRRHSECSTRRI